ncbi:TRAP transporter substrate-binding protein DctP [uncultured Desulfosarcina sp.]|uniref:TRAP transporter substrate-binding protein DctP n=1 Tax=uncultured Desulfosarcina sp. TaxID=218289 RepID=UPI0029C90B9A|nr:TRAP transporter substrate-binding protein DctP [uncultured Desulfosarcina sp.]
MKRKSSILVSNTIICIITICLLIIGFSGTAVSDDKVIKWKLQTHWPQASPAYKLSGLAIVEKIKEATNGRLIIEPYNAGALVPNTETYNAVSRGMIQMGTSVPGYFQNRVPLASIASGLPFSFKTLDEAIYFHSKLGFEKMMQAACKKDGIFYVTDNVYRTEFVLKKPVHTLEDFNGLKVRSYGALANLLNEMGAAASNIPGSEIYAALSTGVVDGAHWGAALASEQMGFYEVCKYHLKPSLTIAGATCYITNQKAIDKLPDDIRKAFIGVMENHYITYSIEYDYLNSMALSDVQKKYNVEVLEILPEEMKKITKQAVNLWDLEGAKSPENAKAVKMLKEMMEQLGYL